MNIFKKILLSLVGGLTLMFIPLNYLPNNVPIMLGVFVVGTIITFIFADKELKAMKDYNNNFWLSFIRYIMASGMSMTILGSKTILLGLVGLLGFIALLPITYRFIKKQFNFDIPKWLQVILPIAFILLYSYV